jgi:DNA-binding FadR family transcriptional regulator
MTRRTLEELAERHIAVLDALRTRDPILAEAAIRKHIDEPREWVLNIIKAKEEEESAGPANEADAGG